MGLSGDLTFPTGRQLLTLRELEDDYIQEVPGRHW
jgi:hypothetical protein